MIRLIILFTLESPGLSYSQTLTLHVKFINNTNEPKVSNNVVHFLSCHISDIFGLLRNL